MYTVVAGDTLGIIADYTGSTTAQLQQANCLGNADLIYVGDRLYVPRLPVVPTSAPATITFPNLPALTVAPFWLDAQGRPVTYSQTVRISAGEVLNAVAVNFYVNDVAGGTPISIGQDVDPWDGAFIDYTFFQPGTYTFSAVAASDDGQTNGTPFTVRYDPSFVPPEGVRNILTITPYLSFSGGVYNIQPGTTVTLRWPDAPVGALRVDFVFAPFDDLTGIGTTLGTDINATDGVYIAWGVTSGLNGYIQAFATMPDGSTITSEVINVNSVQ
ncbi:MAG TPA: LysM peptidoglycan-binding domain-containing protein [Aggregatilineaceae bacterium]|nr:LysM peptidoglycan-binding domain-containing protein [Aggregatilineaceae bacterium]